MASLLDVSKGVFKSFKNSYPAKCTFLTLFRMVLFRVAHGGGGGAAPQKRPQPKICHTYPAHMKLGTVIPYLKKTQQI